ncbi:MAG: glycosyltransferase family 39 protein [Anaerolineae bacterium]|nr:glycosyltransferase family 39 protein [Anaerolineae bacterium]
MKTSSRKQPNRTLTSILLAIAALVLGLIAQSYFAHPGLTHAPKPTDGLIVYAIAVIVFAFAVAPTPATIEWSRFEQTGVNGKRFAWFMALFCPAGLSIILSLLLFREETTGPVKWMLYLGAALLFILSIHILTLPAASGVKRRFHPGIAGADLLLLFLILLIAAFFRLYRFRSLPYGLWYDEADNGLWARQLLQYPELRPIYAHSTNLPAHFLYLIAFSFRLFGDSMYAIRAVAVMFGLLTVVAAYFCGRELFGWHGSGRYIGLILAFTIAVSRWDVNWSRIGMHGVTVPFFELWTVAALLRGLRTGRLTAFAWSGAALGSGLCFYSPIRIFPAIIGGFLLIWLGRWLWQIGHRHLGSAKTMLGHMVMTWGTPLILFSLGVLIVVAPVAQFALAQPELFWDRAKRISILKEPAAQAHPIQAVLTNTAKHLLMFNYQGDPNGRHNLPGLAMLDRISGVLFVLGAIICLFRWRDLRSILVILWLLVPLSGGIFSVSFEAPQSLRSIGALPAAYILVCFTCEWFATEWQRVFGPGSKRHLRSIVFLLLVAIGLSEGITYFHIWAHDFTSWAAFNPAETHMAQDINRYQAQYDLRFDPLLTAHLATRYLAPDYQVYRHFDPAMAFPIQNTDKEGVLFFIAPDTNVVRDDAKRLYPDVQIETFDHSGSDRTVLFKYIFDREAITSVQGLDASYSSLQSGEMSAHRRVDATIDFDWQDEPPVAYPLQAVWTGGLFAPQYGTYTLHVDAPGDVLMTLDGQTLFSGRGIQNKQIVIAQGVHALYLDCRLDEPGPVRLMWIVPWDNPDTPALSPVPPDALYRSSWPINGLVGRFYAQANLESDLVNAPDIVRIDRQIAHYFHFLPLPRPYVVEWRGQLLAPVDGTYQLGIKAVSSAVLHVDGERVLQSDAPGQYMDIERYLSGGPHDISIRFFDNQDRSQIYLYWQVPGSEGIELVPPEALFLPQDGAWWDGESGEVQ